MVQRSEVPLVGGGRKSPRRARRAGITLLVSIGLLVAAMSITGVIDAPASGAATLTGTASHYEATTDPSTLLAQGETRDGPRRAVWSSWISGGLQPKVPCSAPWTSAEGLFPWPPLRPAS